MHHLILEYVWFNDLFARSKKRIYQVSEENYNKFAESEYWRTLEWNYDGSSTNSIEKGEKNTEILLKPVRLYQSYLGDKYHFVLYCTSYKPDGTPEKTNFRDEMIDKNREDLFAIQVGFEQEYFVIPKTSTAAIITSHKPSDSIDHYCGVGTNSYRTLSDKHIQYCLNAGVQIVGTNAEVVEGQWEYQIFGGIVDACDDLMMSRYLLYLLAEEFDAIISFHPKPFNNVNGSGCHINISTSATRDNIEAIESLMTEFSKYHQQVIAISGMDNQDRLCGKYETSDMNTFSYDVGTRNTSIRIPMSVKKAGKGYFEDRRPGANVNPYKYGSVLLDIISDDYLNN